MRRLLAHLRMGFRKVRQLAEFAPNSAIGLTWAVPSDSVLAGCQILRRLPRQNQNTLLVYLGRNIAQTTPSPT